MSLKDSPYEHKSSFADRETVGKIYRDAQINYDGTPISVGDMTREIMSSLVEDLNETISSDPFQGRPFYITVFEKREPHMPNAILRRLYTSLYRPYPEDDTMVWYVNPKSSDVRFCWCLPHYGEMLNMLANHTLYEPEMIEQLRAWKNHNLYHFGFIKESVDENGNDIWRPNPHWEDKRPEEYMKKKPSLVLSF